MAYELEPWGPLRDDLREAGSLMVQAGVFGASTVWPYIVTADDVLEELDRLDAERENNGR